MSFPNTPGAASHPNTPGLVITGTGPPGDPGPPGADAIWTPISQTQYNSITPNPGTLYVIDAKRVYLNGQIVWPEPPSFKQQILSVVNLSAYVATVQNPTGTNTTLIGVHRASGGNYPTAVTDSKGNTWTVDHTTEGTSTNAAIVRCEPQTPLIPGDTITLVGGSTSGGFGVGEFSGRGLTKVQAIGNTASVAANSLTATTATPLTQNNFVIVAGATASSNVHSIAAGSVPLLAKNLPSVSQTHSLFSGLATNAVPANITLNWGGSYLSGIALVEYAW